MRRGVAVVAVLAAALCSPVGALAAGTTTAPAASTPNPITPNSPFSPGVPLSPTQAPTTSTAPAIVNPTTTSSTDNGLSGGGVALIAIGALALIGGISFFIWRDARRRAPVRHHTAEATAGTGGRSGSKSRQKPRKLSPAERRRRKRGRAR